MHYLQSKRTAIYIHNRMRSHTLITNQWMLPPRDFPKVVRSGFPYLPRCIPAFPWSLAPDLPWPGSSWHKSLGAKKVHWPQGDAKQLSRYFSQVIHLQYVWSTSAWIKKHTHTHSYIWTTYMLKCRLALWKLKKQMTIFGCMMARDLEKKWWLLRPLPPFIQMIHIITSLVSILVYSVYNNRIQHVYHTHIYTI